MNERDRQNIEKVEITSQPTSTENQEQVLKSMVYRGSNYNRVINPNQVTTIKGKVALQYRGVQIQEKQPENI